MSATPKHGLPFPGGDSKFDIQGDLERLAMALDSKMPPPVLVGGQSPKVSNLEAPDRTLYMSVGEDRGLYVRYQDEWHLVAGGD